MKQRIKRIGIWLGIAAVTGCTYAAFVTNTGRALPCGIYLITGFKCPGCGVTRMCLSLMQLDFKNAFYSNQMLFVLLPVLSYLFGSYTLRYVKTGRWSLSKGQTVLTYICIVLLLMYAVYRNIRGI
ncbi:MAG: DUF2752 domain-containing protein [Lachnospiraceae bacterium]